MLEIAKRNDKMDLLPFKDLQAAKQAYQFQNLQDFLDIYYAGCAVLLTERVRKLTNTSKDPLRLYLVITDGIHIRVAAHAFSPS